jgi:hypothetical protein
MKKITLILLLTVLLNGALTFQDNYEMQQMGAEQGEKPLNDEDVLPPTHSSTNTTP